jgi:hypothetical protein
MERFSGLAKKHGLSAEDAASVAFEAMRSPSVRYSADPWAVIVRAVVTSCRAWQFADEALTSIETARRGGLSGCRAERLSEREIPPEYDTAFAVDSFDAEITDSGEGLSIREQAEQLAGLFAVFGWERESVVSAIEIVLRKLADAGSRPAAYEALRREHRWRLICCLPAESWTGLLRLLLGFPSEVYGYAGLGRGVLLRVALGESLADLALDAELAEAITRAAPERRKAADGV